MLPEPAVNSEVSGKQWKASSLHSYCPRTSGSKEIHIIEYVFKTSIYFFLPGTQISETWGWSDLFPNVSLTASPLPLSQDSAFSPGERWRGWVSAYSRSQQTGPQEKPLQTLSKAKNAFLYAFIFFNIFDAVVLIFIF